MHSSYDRTDYEWRIAHNGEGKTPNMRCHTASWVYKECIWMVCGSGAGLGKSSEVWRFFLGQEKRWERVKCTGDPPSCRDGHSWTYIGNGKFVIFGGQGFPAPNNKLGKGTENSRVQTYFKREVYNDLFQFDCNTSTWTPIYPNGLNSPMGRRGHSAIYINRAPPSQNPPSTGNNALKYGQQSIAGVNSVNSSSSAVSNKWSVNSSISAASAKSTRRQTAGLDMNTIPPNSLLVFGGSGIELSKYTEQIYNDVWVFCLDTNCWSRHEFAKTGVEPKPVFDHRAEKIGNCMVVLGGITGTPKSLGQDYALMTDAMLLNLKSLSWSYIKLWDRTGRLARFNFHGFSMSADIPNNPTTVIIFGGKEVVDNKAASSSKQNPPSTNVYAAYNTFTLSISDGTLTPLKLREDSSAFMDNRFGHLGVSAMSVEGIHHHFEVLAKPKKQEKKKNPPRVFDPLTLLPIKVEPLMYVFGGSNIDHGGFCDPILYELVKIQSSTENPYNPLSGMSAEMEESPLGGISQQLRVSFAANNSEIGTDLKASQSTVIQDLNGSDGDLLRSGFLAAEDSFLDEGGNEGNGMGLGIGSRTKSIWYNMQVQTHQSAGQTSAAVAASTLVLKQPSNWTELKLALSPPLSVRSFDKSLRMNTGRKQLSRISSPQMRKTAFSKSAPLLKSNPFGDMSALAPESSLSPLRGASSGSSLFNNSKQFGGLDALSSSTRDLGSKGGSRPTTPQVPQQQQQDADEEGDLLVDENRGDSREVRIKMLAATMAPIIRNKTKVEARQEFRKLLPSLTEISHN